MTPPGLPAQTPLPVTPPGTAEAAAAAQPTDPRGPDPLRGAGDVWAQTRAESTSAKRATSARPFRAEADSPIDRQYLVKFMEHAAMNKDVPTHAINTPQDTKRKLFATSTDADLTKFNAEVAANAAKATQETIASLVQMVATLQQTVADLSKNKAEPVKTEEAEKAPVMNHKDIERPPSTTARIGRAGAKASRTSSAAATRGGRSCSRRSRRRTS